MRRGLGRLGAGRKGMVRLLQTGVLNYLSYFILIIEIVMISTVIINTKPVFAILEVKLTNYSL